MWEFGWFQHPIVWEDFNFVQHVIALAVLGLVPAMIAAKKGRSFVGWWLFGFVLFVIALPAAWLVESLQGRKKCPGCTELISRDAAKCPFCGRDFYKH